MTQSQWAAVMGSNPLDGIGPYGKPHPEKNKGPNLPIVGVSWDDAQVFMEKVNANLGSEDGGKMSLPIAKGKFQMGSGVQEEGYRFKEPRHEVRLTRDYYLDAFEVTHAQYSKLMGNNPGYFQGEQVEGVDSSKHPVDRMALS